MQLVPIVHPKLTRAKVVPRRLVAHCVFANVGRMCRLEHLGPTTIPDGAFGGVQGMGARIVAHSSG
ncbi:UNVERIFIED_CONTAM: hypothetical protein Sradi_5243200 [Sesamum radiatum]|uniref:Uncharacterized protein n=1 Tax=Sesamum radiatum TaxID=300843 RepID=A0AAW2LKN3_SESRA